MRTVSETLEKISILEPMNPNKSTGIINGKTSGILNWNDIAYPSFYRAYKELTTNYWIPDEVDMKQDAKQYPNLLKSEKDVYDAYIGLLATLDSPQTRFIYNVAEYITDPAVHAIAAIIGQQEAIHNESYSYALSSITDLNNQNRIFNEARVHPIVIERNKPIMKSYDEFMNNKTGENLLKALIQSTILEGVNFYSGFAYFYNLARQNKMMGTAKIISFINRDELAHSKFIVEVIRAILGENPHLNTDEFTQYTHNAFERAVELERDWAGEMLGRIPEMDVDEMLEYVRYRGHKMGSMLGMDIYPDSNQNVMPWIKAYADNFEDTKTDFFEGRVSSYKKTNSDNKFDELDDNDSFDLDDDMDLGEL